MLAVTGRVRPAAGVFFPLPIVNLPTALARQAPRVRQRSRVEVLALLARTSAKGHRTHRRAPLRER
jgi:hypothetical protein